MSKNALPGIFRTRAEAARTVATWLLVLAALYALPILALWLRVRLA